MSATPPAPKHRVVREAALFLLASLVLAVAVFGDALWGRSILAPVDIAPALWERFAFADPQSDGIPQNQHLVDQLGYDLPLQQLMHEAWRRGEVPWWNPYTYGGRPLLADAHCNGADPIRVATYLAVPDFVLAYNWTRVAHWLWGAMGLFLLLRRAGNAAWLAGLLALAGEIAGWKTQLFGHPWVEGALCWYPWLWLAWIRSLEKRSFAGTLCGTVCVAAILLAGNLQSHAWLLLFALAVMSGYAGRSLVKWVAAIMDLGPSLILGGLLAAPLLLAELELYSLNVRPLGAGVRWPVWNAPLAFGALHPWLLGTARTGSYMALGVGAFGFALWAGSVVLPLAAFGCRATPDETNPQRAIRRTSLALVAIYLVAVATPLFPVLYARYAGIPVLGLLLLAGSGVRRISSAVQISRAARWLIPAMTAGVLLAGDFIGRVIYPIARDRFEARLLARMDADGYAGRSLRLRKAQVAAVPRELSLSNPEIAAAAAAWIALSLLLVTRERTRPAAWACLLALNLAAPLLHTRRFLPNQPVALWERLLAGSPEQNAAIQLARTTGTRIEEVFPGATDSATPSAGLRVAAGHPYGSLFPQEWAALFRVPVSHGYAALIPKNAWDLGPGHAAEAHRHIRLLDGSAGLLGLPRFEWFSDTESASPVALIPTRLTLNAIEVSLPAQTGGRLLWHSTPYPGWTARAGTTATALLSFKAGNEITIPASAPTVTLSYRPSHQTAGLALALFGALALAAMAIERMRHRRIR